MNVNLKAGNKAIDCFKTLSIVKERNDEDVEFN